MRCGNCGCLITAETQKGHNYYRCTKKKQTCNEKYLREENLVEQMKTIIQKVSIARRLDGKYACRNRQRKRASQKRKRSFCSKSPKSEKWKLSRKLINLLDLFIEGKGISA